METRINKNRNGTPVSLILGRKMRKRACLISCAILATIQMNGLYASNAPAHYEPATVSSLQASERNSSTILLAQGRQPGFSPSRSEGQDHAQTDAGSGESASADAEREAYERLHANKWAAYLLQLKSKSREEPAYGAVDQRVNAEKSMVASARHDYGLTLSASYNRYPGGLGTTRTTEGDTGPVSGAGGVDDYGEVRLSYRLFDQLARRAPRIDSAKASLKQAELERSAEETVVVMQLIREAVMQWTVSAQREALTNALNNVERAKGRLNLAEEAALPDITQATPDNVVEALILSSRIQSSLDALPVQFIAGIPAPPEDYSILPQRFPDTEDIMRVVNDDPTVKSIEWQSRALESQARSLRGNGIEVNIFGGQVVQTGPNIRSRDEVSEIVGLQVQIPLGASQYHERRSLESQANVRAREAEAALSQRRRALLELSQGWKESVAQLVAMEAIMLQQGRLYEQMRQRASRPQAGRAPEPWQLDLQEARFWQAVADVWEQRGAWMQYVLTWAAVDAQYLDRHQRSSNPVAYSSFCAPLRSCVTREF